MKIHSLALPIGFALLLSACSSNVDEVPVTSSGGTVIKESTTFTNPTAPNTQVKNATHGMETGLSICALSGENGVLANGVATAYYFEDKGSIVGIQLNVAAADTGTIYVAWLEDSAKKHIQIGVLENNANDVRHSVRLDTAEDLRSYKNVIIAVQKSAADTTPGKVIATGILKDAKR